MALGGVGAAVVFPLIAESDVIYKPGRFAPFFLTCIAAGLCVSVLSVGIAYVTLYRTNRYLEDVARRDPLTGLGHHGQLISVLSTLVDTPQTPELRGIGLIIFDIDHFKNINDTYGHQVGDLVLIQMAQTLTQTMGLAGQAFRMGGEEFAIVLPFVSNSFIEEMADRICQAIRHQNGASQVPSVTVSAGIARFPDDAYTAADLIKCADDAMYLAKAQGRNCVARHHRSSNRG